MRTGKSLLYSAGNIAASLSASVFSTYIIFYYVDTLKMPAELIGLGMGIYGIWNAINDPLLGQMSDRTRTRWGRRKPYILLGSIPFVLAFMFVWMPPYDWLNTIPAKFAYFIAIIFLFDALYTLVIINWTSLYPEMYRTQKERTKVSAFRQAFGIVGNIIGVALPPMLYGSIGWGNMGILFGVITLVSLGLSLLGSREDPTYSQGDGLSIGKALAATFKNKSFLTYVIGAMFLQFTFVMLQAGIPFYAKYVLQITDGFMVSLLLGTIFISAMIFVGLWSIVANKKGSKYTMIISAILYGLALIPFWFVRDFTWGVITAAVLGIGLAGLMILLDVMLSDIVDEDEIKTGARREGMYFGVNGFMVRLGISVQSVLMGYILATSGYDANLAVGAQPEGALVGIKSLITIVPIVSLVFAILFFCLYPLYGDRLKKVKEMRAQLHPDESKEEIA